MKDLFFEIMKNLKLFSKKRDGILDFRYNYNDKSVGVIEFTLTLWKGEAEIKIKRELFLTPNETTLQCEDRFFKNQIQRLIKRGIIGMFEDAQKTIDT